MALKLNFKALSVSGAVDQHTGNLSVFDIIEEVRAPQVPVNMPSVTLSLSLEKTNPEAHQGKLFIHIITPDGKSSLIGNGDMSVPAEQKRMKALFRFGGLPLMSFGTHRIVVSWLDGTGQKEGEALFDFDVIQAAQVAQGAPQKAPAGVTH